MEDDDFINKFLSIKCADSCLDNSTDIFFNNYILKVFSECHNFGFVKQRTLLSYNPTEKALFDTCSKETCENEKNYAKSK